MTTSAARLGWRVHRIGFVFIRVHSRLTPARIRVRPRHPRLNMPSASSKYRHRPRLVLEAWSHRSRSLAVVLLPHLQRDKVVGHSPRFMSQAVDAVKDELRMLGVAQSPL
jgi:hypothetical protein